ncbi:hypothetical protein SZ64_13055 [Erythrobacter sp. SG61-1L]|uniref:hypothetical protein n=1 Tax=Erythrobacter sp. SG61-1L TaxID=1603897 RepID=UPI0006C8F31D|nr:hypothetical protein [Erythrobacter sp. SG61-1L]KPL68947.1 hypothetical protein SZ64_13055 [Erythrobacter sp. SG61-1L]
MQKKGFAGMRRIAAIAGILLGIAIAPAAAQGPELAMLDGLRSGSWELRIRGDSARKRICVHNGRDFIQIRHKQPGCSRFVVNDGASEVTVHYSCPNNGYGQTTIRKESPQLIQISTQGVEGKSPFNFMAEARHVGPC